MDKQTAQINKIIADTDIKKWQLAQLLMVFPSYVTTQLRDGIKTQKGLAKYYHALKDLLEKKQEEINKAREVINASENEIKGE